jgi:predicted nucleotidyltransferase component of viral defense system
MNFEEIRRLTITALFSDDMLFEQLVLKGGNAMSLVLGISQRASLDLDFSLERDFDDLQDVQARMERALASRFAPFKFVPFDVKLLPKPSNIDESRVPWWGGYRLEFKLVDEPRYQRLKSNLEQLRREATPVGPKQLKVFTVDLSKWEYTEGKTRTEMDSYTIYVYTPAMIALEKVRALCQQMVDYPLTGRTRHPRARDFYDIYAVVTNTSFRFDAPEAVALAKEIFAAKEVPLLLLGKIKDQREFHRADWPSVQTSTSGPLEDFDFYFDFVLREIEPLHALWME